MNLEHLHLHVRDRRVSEAFYSAWCGLSARRRGASLTFLADDAGFDLALMDDAAPEPMLAWFHFGFRLPQRQSVFDLHEKMSAAGVPIRKDLYADESLVSFRCADPDGYPIGFYWEGA